jgi:alpha-galactosidase
LQVRCVAVEYRDFPTVEWTLYFKNTSTHDTPILENIQALDALFERNAKGDFVLHHHKGTFVRADDFEPLQTILKPEQKERFAPPAGRPCGQAWPYFNLEWPSAGVIVVVGWPGQWTAQFVRDAGDGCRVVAGQELTRLRLRPGEEVRTPLIVVQFWKGDWMRAQNVWRRWMLAHNLPRPGGKLPSPIMPACSSHQFAEMINANEENQKLFIDRYLEEGLKIDYWWMDAGWYVNKGGWPNTGTWLVDSNRFPHGLRAITDHAHAKGVKSLVWFEPERVTPGTWLHDQHPEWLLNGTLLNLGDTNAWSWLVNHIDQTLIEQGIDLYRQDYNIDPLDFWRGNDAPDRQGITENHYVTGYLAYWDELRRRHPDMLIDSCASGGHRNDLETLRRALPFLRSDFIMNAVGNQCHTYGLAFWLPYHGTGSSQLGEYDLRSAMVCPHFTAVWDMRNRNLDYGLLRRLVSQWRQTAEDYFGDYYPLTPYSLTEDVWIAWQFDRPEQGQGMVQAFRRRNSLYESARFKLRGLEPKARYAVINLNAPAARQKFTGKDLMDKGLRIEIPASPAAIVITYRKLK